jgi:hypothetical protein
VAKTHEGTQGESRGEENRERRRIDLEERLKRDEERTAEKGRKDRKEVTKAGTSKPLHTSNL